MAIRPVHSSGCPHPHARKEKEREWHSVKGSVMPVGRIIAMLVVLSACLWYLTVPAGGAYTCGSMCNCLR